MPVASNSKKVRRNSPTCPRLVLDVKFRILESQVLQECGLSLKVQAALKVDQTRRNLIEAFTGLPGDP